MDTMELQKRLESQAFLQKRVESPIQSDVSESLPLDEELKGFSKPQLIKYMEGLGYNADGRLSEKTLIENILKVVDDRKSKAARMNEESLKMAVTEDDPVIEIRFFNIESPSTDIEFSYSGKRGMHGPVNKKGFKKCPKYHLFPGEKAKLAYSVFEHLEGLTFVTHKTVFDQKTGMVHGTIPIIKPRFILQPILSKEDILNINKNR